jgi:DNA polymerase-3 subunit delta'
MNGLQTVLAHPKTKKAAADFLRRPSGPLLILGAQGSGKTDLASRIASAALELGAADQLNSHPYFYEIKKPRDKKEIPIESIRAVNKKLGLTAPGRKSIRRVVLINGAHQMSIEAQNALLKMLEEPDEATLFLLTALSQRSLLPTIVSRAQRLTVYPIEAEQAKEFFDGSFTSQQIDSAWNLSRGSAALMSALLDDGNDHPLKMAIAEVKDFFGQTRYQRLLFLERKSKDNENLELFLVACERILSVLHRSAIEADKKALADKLSKDRQSLYKSRRALESNANPRLVCLQLALNLNS